MTAVCAFILFYKKHHEPYMSLSSIRILTFACPRYFLFFLILSQPLYESTTYFHRIIQRGVMICHPAHDAVDHDPDYREDQAALEAMIDCIVPSIVKAN